MSGQQQATKSQERQVVIMFVDIVGSTSLYERIGDSAALRVISAELGRLESIIAAHGGSIVKRLGDGIMATFPDPRAAFFSASAMIEAENTPAAGEQVHFRAGLHYGPVMEVDGDVFGDAVNVAARLQSLGRPGEPLISGDTVNLLDSAVLSQIRFLEMVTVKGRNEPVKVFAIMPPADEEDGTILGARSGPAAAASADNEPRLTIACNGTERTVTAASPPLQVGRDASCGLVVPAPLASRRHATISVQRGRFQITDSSTNGTYITLEDGSTLHLFRDSFDLQGSGRITLGEPPSGASHSITFTVRG